MRRLLPMLTAALLLGLPAAASADSRLEAMFQDDPRILSSDAKVRNATLDEAKSLGVQRIRVTAFWNRFAPNATGTEKPANFDGSNPDAYEKGQWDVLDALLRPAGVRYSVSRINAFNPRSLASHRSLGASDCGWALFVCLGPAQAMVSGVWPHVAWGGRPRLHIGPAG